MDLEKLKEKLGDSLHSELTKFVTDLEGKAQAARDESINHRKGLKAKVEGLEKALTTALEKLGVESAEDLDQLPDARGQAEALKQLESRIKRAERERDEAKTAAQQLAQERDTDRLVTAVTSEVSKHGFIDAEITSEYIRNRSVLEDGEVKFKAEGGKLVPLNEGVAWLAKSKPTLVKAQGGTGSGYRPNGNGTPPSARTMSRADFEALGPAERATVMRENTVLTD